MVEGVLEYNTTARSDVFLTSSPKIELFPRRSSFAEKYPFTTTITPSPHGGLPIITFHFIKDPVRNGKESKEESNELQLSNVKQK